MSDDAPAEPEKAEPPKTPFGRLLAKWGVPPAMLLSLLTIAEARMSGMAEAARADAARAQAQALEQTKGPVNACAVAVERLTVDLDWTKRVLWRLQRFHENPRVRDFAGPPPSAAPVPVVTLPRLGASAQEAERP